MEFVAGTLFLLLAIALVGGFVFLADRFLLRGNYFRHRKVPMALRVGETLEHPTSGIVKAELTYVLGIHGDIPKNKARRRLTLTFEEGHSDLGLSVLIYHSGNANNSQLTKARVVDGFNFDYRVPYEMEPTTDIILSPKATGVSLSTHRMDFENVPESFYVKSLSFLRIFIVSLLFTAVSAVAMASLYCALIYYVFIGRGAVFNIFENFWVNFGWFTSILSIVAVVTFFSSLIFFLAKRNTRRGVTHG